MIRYCIPLLVSVLSCSSLAWADDFDSDKSKNWHQWRGPTSSGFSPHGDPPVTWDEATNIKWKVAIPGSGSATPVVWDERVYLMTAIRTDRKPDPASTQEHEKPSSSTPPQRSGRGGGRRGFRMSTETPTTLYQFVVICLDRNTGKTIWETVAKEEVPHEGHHPSHGFASSSPTTDGKFLYVSFGSRGVYCLDLDGNVKWTSDLGDMETRIGFGEGTSPVVHGDSLIVNWDHEGDSFVACLDTRTGDEKWRVARNEGTTWSTPLVVEHNGISQVVTNASNRTRSYDLATGKLLWECGGQASNPIPSPVALDGVVFCTTGFRGYALYAIPLDATGDITESDKIVWHRKDVGPYVASPLLYDNLIYLTKERNGILSCVDAKTGEVHYANQRINGVSTLYASLAGAAGKVFITGRNGTTVVLKHGPEYEVLATNRLDEGIDASPVIVGNQLLLRGQKHLYCIAKD